MQKSRDRYMFLAFGKRCRYMLPTRPSLEDQDAKCSTLGGFRVVDIAIGAFGKCDEEFPG